MTTLSLCDLSRNGNDGSEPSPQTLRVLHVINGEHYAGAERVQDLLAEHSAPLGVETAFVCVKSRTFEARRKAIHVPLESVPVHSPFPRRAIRELASRIREEDIALLHAHTPRSLWLAGPAAIQAQVPLVYTLHDVSLQEPVWALRALLRRRTLGLLRRADAVIAVSPAALEVAERLELGRRRVLVPNGVPTRRSAKGEPDTPPVVGTVGLLRPRKGIETLVEAAGLLRRRGADFRLKIVGPWESDEYARLIHREVARADVGDITEFPGFVSEIDEVLDQLDWFVMPSVLAEGTPMVVLEAMAAGIPVIGSDVAGVRDLVRHRIDGYLVSPGNSEELAERLFEGITAARSNSRPWRDMSQQARRRQQSLYSAEVMAQRTARCYQQVLK